MSKGSQKMQEISRNAKGQCLWEMSRLRDFYENRHTYQKSPWPQSRRTHPLTYRGHRRSHYRDMGRTLGKLPPCDLYENRHTDRSLHANLKVAMVPKVVGPSV